MTSSSVWTALCAFRSQLRLRLGGPGLALLIVLGAMFLACVTFAVQAEKPWGRTVQKRLEKKQPLQPKEYAIIGLWWAAVANAGLLALLIATSGKWMPSGGAAARELPGSTSDPAPAQTPPPPIRRAPPDFNSGRLRLVTLALLLGALALGAWERWHKLHHSLWNDEEYAIRKFAHGAWEEKSGQWNFVPVTWTDTLFESRNGNNHMLNSVSMHLGLETWRTFTGADRAAFLEYPVRMPAYLAGLATIALVFLLGRELGSPLAGLAGAWLMALHPWHIRYSAEARGYSMMMCFLALSLYGLLLALRTNRLRWWLVFGLSQAVYLLSFAGSLYVAAIVNLVALIELLVRRDGRKVWTLLAVNLLGATFVLQLMLPNIPQILAFLKEPQPNYVPDVWQWYRDLGAVLVVGWPYENFLPHAHHGTDWIRESKNFFFYPSIAPVVFLLLAGAAVLAAAFRGTASRLVIIAPLVAAGITAGLNVRPGSPMTVWYLIYMLIPLVLALPMLVEEMCRGLRWPWTATLLVAWLTLRFGVATSHARTVVRDVDRQPIREAVASIRMASPEALTATFGVSDRQSASYDPKVRRLENAADLDQVISLSRASKTPLYVYYCSDQFGEKRVPDVYQQVTASGAFEKVGEFPGSEELFSYRVYRLKQ